MFLPNSNNLIIINQRYKGFENILKTSLWVSRGGKDYYLLIINAY